MSYFFTGRSLGILTFIMFFLAFFVLIFSISYVKNLPGNYLFFFLFPFLNVILLSCFSFSIYQKGYTLDLLSIIIISLVISSFFFFVIDALHLKKIKQIPLLDVDMVFFSFLIIYIILKIYIINKTGIRVESLIDGNRIDGKEFVIPGISGLVAILQWSLLILFPFINRKKKVIVFTCILIFSFLSAKRGDLVRTLLFISVYYYMLNKNTIKSKNVLLFFVFIVLFGLGFALLGDLRQTQYDSSFSIVSTLGSYYNSSSLSWLFGYTGINLEVLSRIPISDEARLPMNVIIPFYRSGIDEYEVLAYYNKISQFKISGFNASTFLGPMVYDMGQFFWIELTLFLSVTCSLIAFSKVCGSIGSEMMILSLIALLPFGNYLLSSQFLFAIIFSSLISVFFKRRVNE
tara:strand:- start:768 stop:1976 length:1209 start_codon:yes stop_codon:yes gene_type:complete